MTPSTWWLIATVAVIVFTPALVGGYDGAAYQLAGNDATISRLSQRVAWQSPAYLWSVCFLFALLCGHLFTTRPYEPPLARWVSLVLFVVVPYLLVLDSLVAGLRAPGGLPVTSPKTAEPFFDMVLAGLLGCLVGSFLLHQTGD